MEPADFLSALLAIVVIDLVLAGDNAIVIALAARALPAHLQKRAIVGGAIGAIAVRGLMTAIVVWLLKIPGLLLAGGLLLLWIAYKLLVPADDGAGAHKPAASTFWGAMRTIVIADAVMGLDNVLAVAGAAHGSYTLVILGLAISVPIVVWGSTLVLKVVDRYPGVVYVGAGVLVWTSAKMIAGEPLLAPAHAALPALPWLLCLAIPLVLGVAFVRNHRRLESRIHARLAAFRAARPVGASSVPAALDDPVGPSLAGAEVAGTAAVAAVSAAGIAAVPAAGIAGVAAVPAAAVPPAARPSSAAVPAVAVRAAGVRRAALSDASSSTAGELAVLKVLIPVDGGANALRAVRHAIAEYRRHHELELHLVNVQPRVSRHVSRFVSRADRDAWHGDRAAAALAPAVRELVAAGVPYRTHWTLGGRAESICRMARELDVHHIVLGTARKNSLTRMLEDSATHRVLEDTPVPVELVVGESVSRWERWGLPAGALAAGGLLVMAVD